MKKLLSVLLVFVLLIPVGSSVLAYDSTTLSNEGSNDNKTTESKRYIKYDLKTKTESILDLEYQPDGVKPYESIGRKGKGKAEKVSLSDFADPNKPIIDPFTGQELNNQVVKPFEVIGTDGREPVSSTASMPYRALTYIQFENLISTWSCTGGVIANDLVVTNAHCIEGSPLAVTVFPGLNHSSYSYGYYRATEIIYPEEYDSSDNSSAYDYAILRVVPDSGANIGERAGILSWREAGTINSNSILSTYGYPGDKMSETGEVSLWGMEGRSDSYLHSMMAFYNMDTMPGQSGSPVFDMYHRMIAVHNASYTLTEGTSQRTINGGPKIRSDFTTLVRHMGG